MGIFPHLFQTHRYHQWAVFLVYNKVDSFLWRMYARSCWPVVYQMQYHFRTHRRHRGAQWRTASQALRRKTERKNAHQRSDHGASPSTQAAALPCALNHRRRDRPQVQRIPTLAPFVFVCYIEYARETKLNI